jgi:predicted signal transduction protein with EAL and GGDEF domain
MLQRYDISVNGETNCLSIKEFAVIEGNLRKRDYSSPANENFSLMCEVVYDADHIREAIVRGQYALISALRSDDFFPISSCVELIAERVIELFNGKSDSFSELFFDDRTLLSKDGNNIST